jgi:hypothetical protein
MVKQAVRQLRHGGHVYFASHSYHDAICAVRHHVERQVSHFVLTPSPATQPVTDE